jgi:hypothetical protein
VHIAKVIVRVITKFSISSLPDGDRREEHADKFWGPNPKIKGEKSSPNPLDLKPADI